MPVVVNIIRVFTFEIDLDSTALLLSKAIIIIIIIIRALEARNVSFCCSNVAKCFRLSFILLSAQPILVCVCVRAS